jgi:hypothetical protein
MAVITFDQYRYWCAESTGAATHHYIGPPTYLCFVRLSDLHVYGLPRGKKNGKKCGPPPTQRFGSEKKRR